MGKNIRYSSEKVRQQNIVEEKKKNTFERKTGEKCDDETPLHIHIRHTYNVTIAHVMTYSILA